MFGERVSPGPANQRSFLCLPCCWGQMLIKQQLLIHLDCLCSVSLPISVFFTHSLHVVLRKGQGTVSKRRGLITYVQTTTSTAKLLSPNHLWSLPAAPHSDLSARQYKGVIPGYDVRPSALQHVIRGYSRSFSATDSLRHREGNLCSSCGRKTYPETV